MGLIKNYSKQITVAIAYFATMVLLLWRYNFMGITNLSYILVQGICIAVVLYVTQSSGTIRVNRSPWLYIISPKIIGIALVFHLVGQELSALQHFSWSMTNFVSAFKNTFSSDFLHSVQSVGFLFFLMPVILGQIPLMLLISFACYKISSHDTNTPQLGSQKRSLLNSVPTVLAITYATLFVFVFLIDKFL
jgi:hypothetical protein